MFLAFLDCTPNVKAIFAKIAISMIFLFQTERNRKLIFQNIKNRDAFYAFPMIY